MKITPVFNCYLIKLKTLRIPVFLFVLIVTISCIEVKGQDESQFWATYNQQARVSKKWGYTFDLNYRTRGVSPITPFLYAARVGVNYHINPVVRITAGYALFANPIENRDVEWLIENRLYEQIQFNNKKKNLLFINRIRLEQRYREYFESKTNDDLNVAFTFRARYLFQLQGPLLKKSGTEQTVLSWHATNEILLHWGENLNGNYFDQNRTLAGLIISPNKKIDIAVSYQFILFRQPATATDLNINSLRLTLFHNLDFRKE